MAADPYASSPEVRRLRWLFRIASFWAVVIFGRLVYLKVFQHEQLLEQAGQQQEMDVQIQAARGTVMDRRQVKLIVSVPAYSVNINPRKLRDAREAADVLARTLSLDPAKLRKDIERARDRNRGFLWIKRKITHPEYQKLTAWAAAKAKVTKAPVAWLEFQQESRREYPHGELAGALLGAVDSDEKGIAGVERSLEEDLRGEDGTMRILTDSRHRAVDTLSVTPPAPGKNVALTIDSQLQFFCDRELEKAVKANNCRNGTIVVMNPHNGEVYAMSSYPPYDRTAPVKNEDDLRRQLHLAVYQSMDPGSIFKMVTFAAALETTRLRPRSPVNCGNGIFRFGDHAIHDTHSYSWLPMQEVLWHSSNVGSIHIGLEVGRKRMYDYIRRFGFGEPTGILLPGETKGILTPEPKWRNSSLYYLSMGHEIAVTTMQMAQACSVFANGGYRVRPKLVLWRQRDGQALEMEPGSPRRRVINAATAVDMRNMSEGVVLYGTGKKAKVKGFTIGGKTGTAQMVDTRTKHYAKVYSSSFMGYGPLNAPKVVVVVTLNGSKKYAGDVSAPVFAEVTGAALRILGEQPDIPESTPVAPDPANRQLLAQNPPEPQPQAPRAEPANQLVTGPKVPDFRGMDKRAVLRASAELGLPVEMSGAGVARSQSPPAGSALAAGEAVLVRFAR